MPKTYPFQPDYAVPPGATLKETLEAKGLSQADLAVRSGMAEKTISQIVNGIAPISCETAEKLELVLGIPASFWNASERTYRQMLVKVDEAKRLEKDVDWLQEIPLATLIKRGFIQKPAAWSFPPLLCVDLATLIKRGCAHKGDEQRSLVREALRFFGVSNVEAWRNTWEAPAVQYRGQAVQKKRPGYVAAWLRVGEIQAEGIATEPFDAGEFKTALAESRKLTVASATQCRDKVAALCATAGVAIVFTKEIPIAGVSGATRWLTKDKALIQLSLKYKIGNQLWFAFFHEAGHILLHGKKQVFIEYGISNTTEEEREANQFARDLLIPQADQHRLPYLKTRTQIREFANAIGTSPGIVDLIAGALRSVQSPRKTRASS